MPPTGGAAGSPDGSEAVESAGHFRIYLGAAPGVGKTFAMLNEGRRRHERGTDVVVALAEAHGRPRTAALLEGLEILPLRQVAYRGATFEEMDLAAVLARRPRVALVDELAHTKVPGSGPHAKRWQDVVALLEAGIDVITTVNIQHLESLADAVEAMTGSRVQERVPDWVVRKADQIELVDSSPEQLRRRMLHGNVYPPERAAKALEHFFRSENLVALRELALRFLADETDDDLLERLRGRDAATVWETAERLAVAVTAAPGTDGLLRRAARIAQRSRAELSVVHVVTAEEDEEARRKLAQLQELAGDLGACWVERHGEDPVRALVAYAREAQVTQLVLGASGRSRLRQRLGGGGVVARVLREAADADIDVHVIARRNLRHEHTERDASP